MKVAIIGNGGREHAIIKKIKENKKVSKIFAIPGNGGISQDAECINIETLETEKIMDFIKENNIDFVIVSQDDPLVKGTVDELDKIGIPSFGPNKAAAIIEGSKVFSKNLMKKYNIPTAKYEIFEDKNKALEYLETAPIPTVIKADGLALGKGVVIANTRNEARKAVIDIMENKVFGESGNNIVIEEFLEGYEVTILAFTDGKTVTPMLSSSDHKRALDNDEGLNTGGMGTIAPNPFYTEDIAKKCMDTIFIPTIEAMNKEKRPFKGCLYFGLIITKDGPKVIEYNCRFGDPETQVVLPLLETDLLEIMFAIEKEKLKDIEIKFKNKNACCVIMASGGYPIKYEKGYEIQIPTDLESEIFFAGTKVQGEKIFTNGGRVLGVTAISNTLKDAINKAYKDVRKISFKDAHYRTDIGKKYI